MLQSYILCLLSVLAFAGLTAVEARRPLIRAPRDARRTGDYMIVLDKDLSSEKFHQLLAQISKVSDGAAVQSYVENVAKVVTASLSPYSLEIVSLQKTSGLTITIYIAFRCVCTRAIKLGYDTHDPQQLSDRCTVCNAPRVRAACFGKQNTNSSSYNLSKIFSANKQTFL